MNFAPLLPGLEPRTTALRWVAAALRDRSARCGLVLGLLLLEGTALASGLLLLLPLLGLAGIGDAGGDLASLSDGVLSALGSAGVPPSLGPVLAAFVLLAAAGALLRRAREIAAARLEAGVTADLRKGLFRSVSGMEWLPFARLPSASLAYALTEGTGAAGTAVDLLLTLAAEAVLLAACLAVSVAVSPAATAFAAAAGAVLFLAFHRWVIRGRDDGEEAAASLESLHRAVHEHLGGGRVTRGHGLEDRARSEVDRRVAAAAAGRVAMERGMADARAWFTIAGVVTLAALVLAARGLLGLGAAPILLLIFLFSRILPRLQQVRDLLHGLATLEPEVRAVLALRDRCDADAAPGTDGAPEATFRGEVRLEGAGFSYHGAASRPALEGVDLSLLPGEAVAVSGPSGSGKTTLADLAAGLLAPTSGRVLVDGLPLEGDRRRAWRRRVGYVPEEAFLFHDAIRANLLYARPEASEADLREALRLAGAADLLDRIPGGLDAVVGDRGVLLSAGERQRIAIARALLRRPALLVLDGATGSLDAEAEARVLASLRGMPGAPSILLVTHRSSAARWTDRVVRLSEGRVVADPRVRTSPAPQEAVA